jgi:hypothetical protein
MPSPIATADRLLLHRLARQGWSVLRIARRLKVSPRSVRRLLARPAEQLVPSYERCGRRLAPDRQAWQRAAADLRRAHPAWGAQRLLLDLRQQALPGQPPALRTLERWLAQTELPAAAPGRRRAPLLPRASCPHERWQMDAMDQVRLGNGDQASCLRIIDECSGAPLGNQVFPPRQLGAGAGQPDASAVA